MKVTISLMTIVFFSLFMIASESWAQLSLFGDSSGGSSLGTGEVGVKQQNLEVILGMDLIRRLDFIPHNQIQVGNGEIIEVELIPQRKEVTFRGLKPGRTTVTLRDSFGNIKARFVVRITATSQSKIVQELKSFFKEIEGLEYGIEGEHVFIGGKLVVPEDMGKITYILEKPEYSSVMNLVELSEHTQRVIAKNMQNEMQNNGMRNVTVRIVNKRFWLEGTVSSKNKLTLAQKLADAYLPDNIQSLARRTNSVQTVGNQLSIIQNFITVNAKKEPAPAPKLVKITAQFVEIVKDFNRVFGFKWTPMLGGERGAISFGKSTSGGVTTKSNATLSGTILNLFPKLAAAKGAGHARILQSGMVIVQNSRPAKINKGTTMRFEVGSGEFTKSETDWSGFSLDVTPTIMEKEQIELRPINISVSRLVGEQKLENKIETSLIVKSKASAVVGGVAVDRDQTSYDRDQPGEEKAFEDAAPLFSFLRSKSYVNSKNQFVVFITPEIVESATRNTEAIKKKFRRRGL